jgi:hypothetical protein
MPGSHSVSKEAGMRSQFVYGDWGDNLVFMRSDDARELAHLFQILGSVSTWEALRKEVSRGRYLEILERSDEECVGRMAFEDFYITDDSGRLTRSAKEESEARRVFDRMKGSAHAGVAEFSPDMIYGYQDGDWPEWPAQDMEGWVPESVQEAFGSIVDTMLGGSYLRLDPKREGEIISAMARAGFDCSRDDDLTRSACGA